MPRCQNKLVHDFARVCPNTVVVLHNGSPIDMPWFCEVKAVLECYLCGQAIGEITADILCGIVNPSGHFAKTFPLRLEDNPSYLEFGGHNDTVNYREGVFVGYRYYDHKKMKVLFQFGHGLSYTAFSFSNSTKNRSKMIKKSSFMSMLLTLVPLKEYVLFSYTLQIKLITNIVHQRNFVHSRKLILRQVRLRQSILN